MFRAWPIREALIAYSVKATRRDLEAWRFEVIEWALTAPHAKKKRKAPAVPDRVREHGDS